MANLTSLANVKEFLQIKTADINSDAILNNLISRITAEIETFCNRKFIDPGTNYTEFFHGHEWSQHIQIKNYPIVSVISLHDDPNRNYGSETLIATTDYIIESDSGIIRLDGLKFSKGYNNIRVIYRGGYTATPADLEHAAIVRVAERYLESQGEVLMTVGEEVSTRVGEFKNQAMEILNRYRRIIL